MEKLISVIIPVYNVSQFLKQCVESVLSQSYKNLEIILVDDGSTDDSGMLCDQYAAADSRVIAVHKENGGLSDARNAGIAMAQGEYIGFIDSDDFIHYDMYRVLAEALENSHADIAIANWENFSDGKENEISDNRTGNIVTFAGIETLKFLVYGSGWYSISFSVWDRLYRREIVEDLLFPKGKCYEDVVWSAKVFYKAKKSVYIDRSLYYYRRRSDSIVGIDSKNGVSKRVVTDEIPQIEALIQFLKDIGQNKMADEIAYNLCEKMIRYYAKCRYDKNGLQADLLKKIKSYLPWAQSYLLQCNSLKRKCVLFLLLHAFKVLVFAIYMKNGWVWKGSYE